jgi:hypothetical protein
MHPTNNAILTKFAALVTALALAAVSLAAGDLQAQENADPSCSTVVHYPGAVTVTGKARGTAQAGDFRACSTTYRCDRNAKSVEVFGVGYSSHREGVIASENYAVAANGAEAILASCEAASRGQQGKGPIRSCLTEPQRFQSQPAVAEQAECSVIVGAPANGWTVGNSTCFCEG